MVIIFKIQIVKAEFVNSVSDISSQKCWFNSLIFNQIFVKILFSDPTHQKNLLIFIILPFFTFKFKLLNFHMVI